MAAFTSADLPTGTTNNVTNIFELIAWSHWIASDIYGGLGVQDNNGRNRPRHMWDVGDLPDGLKYFYYEGFIPVDKANWGKDGKKGWKNIILPSTQLVIPTAYKS